MIVLVAGMARSGSMWVFNVTRELIQAGGAELTPQEAWNGLDDRIRALLSSPPETDRWHCLKTHSVYEVERSDVKVITTVRDVRECMLSFMRFMRCDFEQGLAAARGMMAVASYYCRLPNSKALKLNYRGVEAKPVVTAQAIARFLGLEVDPGVVSAICARYSKSEVKRLIGALPQEQELGAGKRFDKVKNRDGSYRMIDCRTFFQSNHITSSQKGEWRTAFTPEQQERLMAVVGEWLGAYGFGG